MTLSLMIVNSLKVTSMGERLFKCTNCGDEFTDPEQHTCSNSAFDVKEDGMNTKEYRDITDYDKFTIIRDILDDCLCFEDPNKTRLLSIKQNIRLIRDDLEVKVKKALKDTP